MPASSGAHDERSEAERPAGLYPRGIVALTPRGEPAVSQSEGPCGPSEVTSGNVTEGRSEAQRDTDPLPSSAAAEVGAAAQGRSGVPTGLSTPDAIARDTERTGVRTVAPQAPQPVGLDITGRSASGGGRRVRVSCAGANCAAGGLKNVALAAGHLVKVKT